MTPFSIFVHMVMRLTPTVVLTLPSDENRQSLALNFIILIFKIEDRAVENFFFGLHRVIY